MYEVTVFVLYGRHKNWLGIQKEVWGRASMEMAREQSDLDAILEREARAGGSRRVQWIAV